MPRRLTAASVGLALAFSYLITPGVSAAPGGPALDVSPGQAAAGATIRLSGSGFRGDCGVLFYWGKRDGLVLGGSDVSADGTFAAAVAVPSDSRPGAHKIEARGRAEGLDGCADDSGKVATASVSVSSPRRGVPAVALIKRVIGGQGLDHATLARAKASSTPIHAIVQLNALPKAGDLDTLAALGIQPLAYLNAKKAQGQAYLAAIAPTVADRDERFSALVRGVQPLLPIDKVEVALAARLDSGASGIDGVVLFFADVTGAKAEAVLARHGVSGVRDGQSTAYSAALTAAQVEGLAAEDAVQFVAAVPPPDQLDVDISRDLVNVDELQRLDVPSGTYLGLTGLGVQVSIHDSGVDEHHGDFAGRMIQTLHPDGAASGSDHGTHVAGIAVGSGAMSNQSNSDGTPNGGTPFQWRGVAPQAQIAAFASGTADSTSEMGHAINDLGVDVSNHSYSYNDGEYTSDMASIDAIVGGTAGLPRRPIVFSAGNQGDSPQYGKNSGYFSLTKSCKNCIMVAWLQDNGALDGGSSHGPTPDGRLKPEVGANGTAVFGVGADVHGPGNGYRTKSGTSMATPVVTGTIALLLQQYAGQFGVDINVSPPLPSTFKAILVQTAVDQVGTASSSNPDTGAATVYGAGPDWGTGYGLVDAQAASELMADELFVEDSVSVGNVTDEHLVSVVPGQDELRVTIAWDDLPGTPNANHAAPQLVNDLDLLLVGPNGEVVQPLVMPAATQYDCDTSVDGTQTGTCTPGADPGPFNTTAAPGIDRLNNVEQVVVADPAPGLWRARVSVLNTDSSIRLPLGGEQTYSIAGVTDARADLRLAKLDSPDPAIAGEQLYYTLAVTNDGPDRAVNVTVIDTLPDGVTYVTDDLPGAGCTEDPTGTLICSLGDLAAGASRTFKIKVAIDPSLVATNGEPLAIFNSATVLSNTPDEDLSDNTDVEGTIVEDRADLEVTKICKPDRPLLAGETGHCTIFVDNHGPSDARSVSLTDVLLSDGTFQVANVAASPTGTCSAVTPTTGGQRFSCDLGTLPVASPSDAGRVTVSYDLTANEGMDINDLATAVATTPDPDTANNAAEEHLAVTAVADLAITKTGPATQVAGTDMTYELSVTNSGPSTAEGVVIEDVVPIGVTIVSVTGEDATCTAGVPGTAALPTTCSFGDLLSGESRTMSVVVHVEPRTLGPVHNDARATSSTFDDDLSDNLATVATDVTGSADLSISKTDTPDPVLAGEPLSYTLSVTNAGPSTARDVRITDTLPAGTTFVSGKDGSGATACTLVQPKVVVCDLGSMDPGITKTVYLAVAVDPSLDPGSVLVNEAVVSSPTDDPNAANNSATSGTTVNTEAEVWIDKQATVRSGNPSNLLTYSLVVHNDAGCETDAQSSPTPNCGSGGPSDARGVVVTDPLPLDPKKLVIGYLSPACTYTKTTHTVVCTSPVIPYGASVTFVIEAQVAGSVGTVANTASVTTTTLDPISANNSNTATVIQKGGKGKK